MVQYANPHPQQPRDQYGRPYPQQGYPQPQPQPQPQPAHPPLGSVMNGPDGRPYQFTPQGWVPIQDPRMVQQPQYPQYPQQQPQYPQYPQQSPQYPPYQPPNQMPQMPAYSPMAAPQPTVYANPAQGRSANRFGATTQSSEPARAVSYEQPPLPLTSPSGDTMQLVSTGKTFMRKNLLSAPLFKNVVRTTEFTQNNAARFGELLLSDCLDELIEASIEKTVNHERSPVALVSDAVLEMIYHKANQKKYAPDLFQADVKAVYKAFKTHLSTVSNRYDLVYLSAINDYLSELVNDTLYPILGTYPVIESFTEDFNELLRHLRNSCSAEVEDLFIENINLTLEKVNANFLILDQIDEPQDSPEDPPKALIERAVIPIPVQVICLNFLSTELGDVKNLSRMLGGLTEMVSSPVAYVCTIDKTVYKAFFGGEKVVLDLLRD